MRELSYAEAIREVLSEEMRRDPTVFIMGEDVGVFGGVWGVTRGMLAEFGERRVRDTPISEAGFVGAGLGAAMMGMRPVVEIMFDDFLMCAGDQIVNQVAKARYMSGGKARVPLTIRIATGAPGASAAQHSQSGESWFLGIPGLKIAVPACPADAKGLLRTAIRGEDPVLIFEHKMLYAERGPVPEDADWAIPFGQAAVVREGSDVTIIALSRMVSKALEAAERLAGEGISAEVIDPRTIKSEKVVFGATVTLENADTGEVTRIKIVGEDEAEPSKGLINVASPLARALIGKSVDDEAVLKTSQITKTYYIQKIEFV